MPLKRINIAKVEQEESQRAGLRTRSVILNKIIQTKKTMSKPSKCTAFARRRVHQSPVCLGVIWCQILRNSCLKSPRNISACLNTSNDLAGRKARTSYTLMTGASISQLKVECCGVCISFFSPCDCPDFRVQLTLTADSVKNNNVKLSIKFMVLEI